jgi:hypothetical protein
MGTVVLQALSGATTITPTDGVTAALTLPATSGTLLVGAGSNNTITFTGNYTLGLTLTANTTVTIPTSGTLVNTGKSIAMAMIFGF